MLSSNAGKTSLAGRLSFLMARPRIKIDEDQVLSLARIHCTMDEMAAVLNCSVDTLERRFADIIKKGREEGKMSLKRSMFKKAITDGNPTMQIWLSKQLLGMRDQIHQHIQGEQIVYQAIKMDDLKAILKKDPFIETGGLHVGERDIPTDNTGAA